MSNVDHSPKPNDEPADGWSGPVYSFDEAVAWCDTLTEGDPWEECVSSAINEWCMFEPLPESDPHWTEEFDGRCAYEQAQQD